VNRAPEHVLALLPQVLHCKQGDCGFHRGHFLPRYRLLYDELLLDDVAGQLDAASVGRGGPLQSHAAASDVRDLRRERLKFRNSFCLINAPCFIF
jgi:hypothetical protein